MRDTLSVHISTQKSRQHSFSISQKYRTRLRPQVPQRHARLYMRTNKPPPWENGCISIPYPHIGEGMLVCQNLFLNTIYD